MWAYLHSPPGIRTTQVRLETTLRHWHLIPLCRRSHQSASPPDQSPKVKKDLKSYTTLTSISLEKLAGQFKPNQWNLRQVADYAYVPITWLECSFGGQGRKKGAAVEDDTTSTTNSEQVCYQRLWCPTNSVQDTPVEPVANANTSGRRKRAKRGKK